MKKQCYKLNSVAADSIRRNPPLVMTILEAAAYATCSSRLMRDLVGAKKVRSSRIGKRIVIRREWLDAMIESRSTGISSRRCRPSVIAFDDNDVLECFPSGKENRAEIGTVYRIVRERCGFVNEISFIRDYRIRFLNSGQIVHSEDGRYYRP